MVAIHFVKLQRIKQQVKDLTILHFGSDQWEAMESLISKESGFNPYIVNPTSGACGLFQNLHCTYELDNVPEQIRWGFNYIENRYQTPNNAWQFWQTHRWY